MTHDELSCAVLRHEVHDLEGVRDLPLRWCDSGCGLLLDSCPGAVPGAVPSPRRGVPQSARALLARLRGAPGLAALLRRGVRVGAGIARLSPQPVGSSALQVVAPATTAGPRAG